MILTQNNWRYRIGGTRVDLSRGNTLACLDRDFNQRGGITGFDERL